MDVAQTRCNRYSITAYARTGKLPNPFAFTGAVVALGPLALALLREKKA